MRDLLKQFIIGFFECCVKLPLVYIQICVLLTRASAPMCAPVSAPLQGSPAPVTLTEHLELMAGHATVSHSIHILSYIP